MALSTLTCPICSTVCSGRGNMRCVRCNVRLHSDAQRAPRENPLEWVGKWYVPCGARASLGGPWHTLGKYGFNIVEAEIVTKSSSFSSFSSSATPLPSFSCPFPFYLEIWFDGNGKFLTLSSAWLPLGPLLVLLTAGRVDAILFICNVRPGAGDTRMAM